jgi:hypothetical protein
MPCTSGTVIAELAPLLAKRFALAENAVKESVVKDIELRNLSISSGPLQFLELTGQVQQRKRQLIVFLLG